jgi:hypothetical protein
MLKLWMNTVLAVSLVSLTPVMAGFHKRSPGLEEMLQRVDALAEQIRILELPATLEQSFSLVNAILPMPIAEEVTPHLVDPQNLPDFLKTPTEPAVRTLRIQGMISHNPISLFVDGPNCEGGYYRVLVKE